MIGTFSSCILVRLHITTHMFVFVIAKQSIQIWFYNFFFHVCGCLGVCIYIYVCVCVCVCVCGCLDNCNIGLITLMSKDLK